MTFRDKGGEGGPKHRDVTFQNSPNYIGTYDRALAIAIPLGVRLGVHLGVRLGVCLGVRLDY